MSTLPAGFSITSIGGKRCTAVPRTATTISGDNGTAAADTSSSSTSTSTSTSSVLTLSSSSSSTTSTITSTTAAVAISTTPSAVPPVPPVPEIVTSQITSITSSVLSTSSASAVALSTTSTDVLQSIIASAAISSTISTTSTSDIANARTTSSLTTSVFSGTIVVAESAVTGAVASTSLKTTSRTEDGLGATTQSLSTGTISSPSSISTSSANPAHDSAASNASSTKSSIAPVIGGVVGGFALLGLIGLLFWFLKKRQRKRDSFLTPLTTGRSDFYEIDRASVGPTGSLTKWKAATGSLIGRIKNRVGRIGTTLKRTFSGDSNGQTRSNINLNRGNSQFLEQIPQHSRSNSAVSGHVGQVTITDRFGDWVDRFKQGITKWRSPKDKYMADPFAAAREKQMAKARGQPDFSTILAMEEQELQWAAERRRMSLSGGALPADSSGSLGLDFSSSFNPVNEKNPFVDPQGNQDTTTNPFADPVTQPKPSISKGISGNYVDTIRRSRGQSMSLSSNPVNQTPQSRYPSTIAASTIASNRDTYRDTYMSSSTSGRKARGRSDPFDLEPPKFTGPIPAVPTPNLAPNTASSYFDAENSYHPRTLPATRTSVINFPPLIPLLGPDNIRLCSASAKQRHGDQSHRTCRRRIDSILPYQPKAA